MIYNQGQTGTCVGFSIANAIEDQLGVILEPQQIHDYYAQHVKGQGARMRLFLERMGTKPMGGVYCAWYNEIFNDKMKNNKGVKGNWLGIIREHTLKKQKEFVVVLSLKIRQHEKGENTIPLSSTGLYTPRVTNVVFYHGLYCVRPAQWNIFFWKPTFLIENSWGESFGKSGFFYIDLKTMQTEVQAAYLCKFEKKL